MAVRTYPKDYFKEEIQEVPQIEVAQPTIENPPYYQFQSQPDYILPIVIIGIVAGIALGIGITLLSK